MAVYLERKLLFVYVNFDWFLKDLLYYHLISLDRISQSEFPEHEETVG